MKLIMKIYHYNALKQVRLPQTGIFSIGMCAFLFAFEGRMWNLILLIPDYCLSSTGSNFASWLK